MSLEAVKEITALEKSLEQEKADAAAAAKKSVADADKAGQMLVSEAKQKAAEQVKGKIAEAEEKAGGVIRQIGNDTAQAKSALVDRAQGNMSKAADLIVERVMALS